MIEFRDPVAEHIKAFILDETAMEIDNRDYPSDPVWREYRETGSRVWLYGNDTSAQEVWTRDMEAVYLDTPLVIDAFRQDHFTGLTLEANGVLKGLPGGERIKEIAFIINARNAVATSKRFAARVCVEIPLFSDSASEISQYARRLYQVCPEHLLPALPYSSEGITAAAELQQAGIPIIIRTGYSPEQVINSIRHASPNYVALGNFHDTREVPMPSAQELRSLLDHLEKPEKTALIACGMDSEDKIRRFMGFPIIVATPDAARNYQKKPAAGKQGFPAPEAGTASGTPGMQNRKELRDIALQSRNAYNELVLIIRNAIDSN
ncbi:hypothetical protein [Marispirochaeta aestuarii]|uniref:hypothetical protein n=1 Tax=Marispirochaeta aestuarii TaxID=1963862 RepID=UPI002ABE965D|nr:hypothetical protein [Marispirochaeta aestuarii]